jgi:predicted DNA-binding protein YlxM (UPF0122 family)
MYLTLTPEQLSNVERMAAAAFSIAEIAEVLEVNADLLHSCVDMPDHPIRKAYRTGQLRRQLELRERIFKDAKNGSSPAQTIAQKLLDELTVKNSIK